MLTVNAAQSIEAGDAAQCWMRLDERLDGLDERLDGLEV